MTLAILATGDEIIHGDTLNTNAHDIAHVLSSDGIPLGFQLTCSDKEADLMRSLQFLAQHHDILILIGGLGPTSDDRTRFALAKFTGEPLVSHAEAVTHIENRLRRANLTLNEGNLQQALFPASATLLPNPNGTAVGCFYRWQDKIFILLPGPPRECLPMFNQHVMPLLQEAQHSQKQLLKWRIFGLAEGDIAQTLEEALAGLECHTGYRLDTPYIEFKVRCTQQWVKQIQSIIDPILAPHSIGSLDKKASDALRELIIARKEPVTIIDEATGGLLETCLSRPDTHHLLNFHTNKKTRLHFYISGLNEYWSQVPKTNSAQLTIHYANPLQEGGETHQIPYRSATVLYYAVEWLSFRLFHLINQLHE